jgi:deoxyhypusine synthase
VDRALVVQKKEPSVERFLKCVCAAAANVKEDYFLCFFVRHLLGRSAASNKTVRQRSCEALAELFAQMPKDADMPENLCSDILHALVPRLDDRFPTIRCVRNCGASGS